MMLWIFRIVIVILSAISLGYLYNVVVSGRKLRQRGRGAGHRLATHRRNIRRVFQITFITLVVVECFGFFLPQIHHHVPIFQIHLRYFAIPFVALLFLLRFWIDGDRYPAVHRFIVYPCLVCGLGTSVIGAYMTFLVH